MKSEQFLTEEETTTAIAQAIHAAEGQGLNEGTVQKIVDNLTLCAVTAALFDGWKMGIFKIAGWSEEDQEIQWTSA